MIENIVLTKFSFVLQVSVVCHCEEEFRDVS